MRKHYFKENNLTVVSYSENISQFDDYVLCFKREYLNDKNRLFYLCSKKKIKNNPIDCQLFLIGKTNEKNQLELHSIIFEKDKFNLNSIPLFAVEIERNKLIFEEQ